MTGHPVARVHAELPAHRRGPLSPDARPHQTEDAVLSVRPRHLVARSLYRVALPHIHHVPGPRGEYSTLHFAARVTGLLH